MWCMIVKLKEKMINEFQNSLQIKIWKCDAPLEWLPIESDTTK